MKVKSIRTRYVCVCMEGEWGSSGERGRETREDTVGVNRGRKKKTKEKNSRINGLRLRASRRDMLALKKNYYKAVSFFLSSFLSLNILSIGAPSFSFLMSLVVSTHAR